MLIREEVANAVRLQACGYQLLKWLEKALSDGFITPETAETYTTSEDAAYSWLDKHYLNLPHNARPERSDLRAFGLTADEIMIAQDLLAERLSKSQAQTS